VHVWTSPGDFCSVDPIPKILKSLVQNSLIVGHSGVDRSGGLLRRTGLYEIIVHGHGQSRDDARRRTPSRQRDSVQSGCDPRFDYLGRCHPQHRPVGHPTDGKGGARLRDVGTAARTQIEKLLGTKVLDDLRVKIAKKWQRDSKQLGPRGF
jgi:hypothetical protein